MVDYLYHKSGMSEEDADEYVANNLKAAIEKIEKAAKERDENNDPNVQKAVDLDNAVKYAQEKFIYWQSVQIERMRERAEKRPAEPAAEEKPATVEPEQPMTEEKPQQAGTIGFEPVEQPTERERYDAERKAKAATITDADIEANREALGIPEGTALTDEARQIYAEDLAEDLMRYERFKRGESDEKARFH